MDRFVAGRFGTNLRSARRLADYSQQELGLLASLHPTEIGLLERGGRIPRIDTFLKLIGSLEVPTGELLEGLLDAGSGAARHVQAFAAVRGERMK